MSRVTAASSTEPLTTMQLDVLIEAIARFPSQSRRRGQQYAAAGRVGPLAYDGSCVRATVRGTELYETLWGWESARWDPDCTCPVSPHCKHTFAVACCIIAGSRAAAAYADTRLERLVPASLLSASGHAAQNVWQAPQSRPSRPTLPRRASTLDRLRAASEPWARQQLLGQLLQQVGDAVNLYTPAFVHILEEPDPDLLCWRLAEEIARLGVGTLPAALEPYTARPDLAARYAERARAGLARELTEWASQRRQTAARRLRLVFGLIGQSTGRIAVTVEARLTTPRLVDAPRNMTQLQQLRNELRRTPGFLPHDQAAVLEWLADFQLGYDPYSATQGTTRGLSGTALRALVARVAGSDIATWAPDIDADVAARAGIMPAAPLRVCADLVQLLPTCRSRDGGLWLDFVFLWPKGRQRPLDEVVYLRGDDDWSARAHPSFVLADGEFSLVIEEPPRALLERFHEAGGLPVPAEERGAIIGHLAQHFPHMCDLLASHTQYHRVQAVIALDLRENDWMQIRMFAHSGDAWRPGHPAAPDNVVFEYTPERGWARHVPETDSAAATAFENVPAAPPASDDPATAVIDAAAPDMARAAEIWTEAPDPRDVEPALDWLQGTQAGLGTKARPRAKPSWAEQAGGWWMHTNPKRMHAFAELWERRPGRVTFFGTERVRRLLSGDERATPVLRIQSSGVDWFTVSATWEAEGLEFSDDDLAALRASTTRFVKLSTGWVRRDLVALHDETAEVLADLGIEAGQGEQRVSLWQLSGATAESLHALQRFGTDPTTLQAAQALRERVAAFTAVPPVRPPAGLTAALRPYQQYGLDFLVYASSLGIGPVLADDMGLGKTVQALAWLLHQREEEPEGGPALVVCPASVVHVWAREAERFAPGLRVLLLTSGKMRHELRRDIPAHDLIVTTYALLRRDLEAWRTVELRAAILDEAQNIKNPDAVVTRAALALRARHRLALTGTPLENRALDLWSIVNFVNPGYLGNRAKFESRYDRPDSPPHVRALLAAKLRPVLLRRTKAEVAPELPERIEERLDCELTKGQRLLYLAELRRSRALVEHLDEAPGGLAQNKIHILAALTRLRQICCHPALAGGKASLGSGKFDALVELLEPLLAEGHKVLLFSQFVECLKLLQIELKGRGIAYHTLTGHTAKRAQVVDAFQNDTRASVFLISLKAGGTGLNLTAASYVVLFDPWWNPAVEAQAIDRTHRIGQHRTVIAYRMLMSGTIEEKIWELQQRKAALARDLLGEGGFARTLTRGDLDYLLAEA